MYNNNIIVKDVININNIDCILFYFQMLKIYSELNLIFILTFYRTIFD